MLMPRWIIASLLTTSAAITIGCGSEIICEEGANCATGSGGNGASGGDGGNGASGGTGGNGGNGGSGASGGAPPTTSVGGAGGGLDLTDYCDDLCACDPNLCNDGFSLQACYDSVNDYLDEGLQAGCDEELFVLDQCLDQAVCDDGFLLPPPCLDPAVTDVDACIYGSPPPPNTICDQAAIICGATPEPGEPCDGEIVCLASCIVDLGSCEADAVQLCVDNCQ